MYQLGWTQSVTLHNACENMDAESHINNIWHSFCISEFKTTWLRLSYSPKSRHREGGAPFRRNGTNMELWQLLNRLKASVTSSTWRGFVEFDQVGY